MSSILTLNGNVLTANGSAILGVAGSSNAQSSKSYTVSESGSQTISPDSGYDSMEAVALTVPASTPSVGDSSTGTLHSTIPRHTSDLYFNIPAGFRDVALSYKLQGVPNGSATGPSSLSASSASVSTGTNTLTLTKTGVTTTPTVSAGYISDATASTASVALTASVTTKAATTFYPSTSDQTISSSTYLTGTQTIKGVLLTNLSAGNIKKDVVVKIGDSSDDDRITSITGTYEGEGGGGYITVTDTTDTAGGTIRTITPIEGTAIIQSSKSVTIDSNTTTTITPDTGNTALGQVVVTTNVSGGGDNPVAEEKDVIFIDYDGTIRYSYTAAEFANLTELPENPTHSGLTAQGWNWTLSDAKEYVSTYGRHCIGQNYTTTDGATRVYVDVTSDTKQPYIGLGVNGSVTIDWGDGSSTETKTGSSLTTVVWTNQHTYTNTGKYCITITPSSGSYFAFLGSAATVSGGSYLFRYSKTDSYLNETYRLNVQKIFLGDRSHINNYGLYHCKSLEILTFPTTMYSGNFGGSAFIGDYNLKSITIPSGKSNLDTSACSNLLTLQRISLPKSITTIGQNAFEYCDTLSFLALPPNVTNYNVYGLSHCYSLKSLVGKLPYRTSTSGGTIPNYFYEYCYGLTDISKLLPSNATAIGQYTFSYCYGLKTLNIPSNITTIGNYAFQYCRGLESINIPNTITTIGTYAFQYCSGATSVSIGTGISTLPAYCFRVCTALTSISIPSNIKTINQYVFYGCTGLTSITIPSTVTSFSTSGYQFYGCTALTSATFNNSITTVPTYCFDGCTALTSIQFPTGCTTIGTYCFRNTGFTTITIPATVTSIGNYAFYGCTSLEEFHFAGSTPPTIGGSSTFGGLPTTCKIYIPTGTLSAYTSQSNMPSSSTYTYIEE